MEKIKNFFEGVGKEAKRTHWPSGKDMMKKSVISLAMIGFFALFFYILDAAFAFLRGVLS